MVPAAVNNQFHKETHYDYGAMYGADPKPAKGVMTIIRRTRCDLLDVSWLEHMDSNIYYCRRIYVDPHKKMIN